MIGSAAAQKIEPLFSVETIAARVDELAGAIAALPLVDPIFVAVLKGSFIFAADLVRALHAHGLEPDIDFIFLASYRDATVSSGRVEVLRDVQSALAGRDVVIVDDILDSGRTLAFAKDLLMQRGARSVRTSVLIDKDVKRAADITADFAGFRCPDVFVVGYGMDLANRYRELPFIGTLTAPNPSP
jgi:hypoxanthine phosphoribosyltransferase